MPNENQSGQPRNIPVTVRPVESSWQSDPIFHQKCFGPNPCIWCRMTGHHNQSPLERQQLMKQAVAGLMALIILLAILVGAAALTWRMIT